MNKKREREKREKIEIILLAGASSREKFCRHLNGKGNEFFRCFSCFAL